MVKFVDNYAASIDGASINESEYFNYDRLKTLVHLFETSTKQRGSFKELFKGLGRSVQSDVSDYGELRRLFVEEFRAEVVRCNKFLMDRLLPLQLQFDFLSKALAPTEEDEVGLVTPFTAEKELDEEGSSLENQDGLQLRRGIPPIPITTPTIKRDQRKSAGLSSSPVSLGEQAPNFVNTKPGQSDNDIKRLKEIKSRNKKIREGSLKRTIATCFESLQALEIFRLLNYTATIKSLKKFDKVHRPRSGDLPLYLTSMHHVYGLELGTGAEIKQLIDRIERLYAFAFCRGDLGEAHGKLRLNKGSEPPRKATVVGFKFGVFCCLLLWLVMDLLVRPRYAVNIWNSPSITYLSFMGNVIVYRWFWGLSVYAWEKANVNYQVLMEMEDSHVPHYQTIFDDCTNLSIVYLLSFIFYLDALRDPSVRLGGSVPANTFLFTMLIAIVMRFSYSYLFSRQFYGVFSPRVLFHLLTPLSRPSTLKDRFAADMACSLTRELTNLVYTTCFVFSGSIVSSKVEEQLSCNASAMQTASAIVMAWPQLVRFAQCLRRQFDSGNNVGVLQWPISYNTLKYSGAILVITIGTFREVSSDSSTAYFIFVVLICSIVTTYQAWYDLYVDWGLMRVLPDSDTDWWGVLTGSASLPDKVGLRNRLMYRSKAFYYFVMCVNPILRFVWTLSLLPTSSSAGQIVYYLSPCLCTIELFRRFLWTCLKLEMDHIHNAEHLLEEEGEGENAAGSSSGYRPVNDSSSSSSSSSSSEFLQKRLALSNSVPYHFEGFTHGTNGLVDGGLMDMGPQRKRRFKNVLSLCGLCTAAVSVVWLVALDISGGL